MSEQSNAIWRKVLSFLRIVEFCCVLATAAFIFFQYKAIQADRELRQHTLTALSWERLNAAQGQDVNRGQVSAIEVLARQDISLAGLDLDNTWLRGADLSGADLRQATFNGADLTNADLSGTVITSASFKRAKLDGANFSRASIRAVDFHESSMRATNFSAAHIQGSTFQDTDLDGSVFRNSKVQYSKFVRARVSNVDFRNMKTNRVKFDRTCYYPDKQTKLFLTADPDIRLRQFGPPQTEGTDVSVNACAKSLKGRE